MQQMLQQVSKSGIGGIKCLGFAHANTKNIEELQAAVAIFGFLLLGVQLQQSQQQQLNSGVWDYAPSREWGGHAILSGQFSSAPESMSVITWGKRVKMTEAFIARQLTEAWVVIWPEHLSDRGFLAGVNVQALANGYEALTGKKFPAEIPKPKPIPTGTGLLPIDPANKSIVYPAGWTATQGVAVDDDSPPPVPVT